VILWVVALRAEARPLVRGLGLRGYPRPTPWPLYVDADGKAALVVSGVGRPAAAGAVGWARGFLEERIAEAGADDVGIASGWVNAGVAGHSEGPVGRALLAHRVVDVATGRAWYPPPVPGVILESDTVFTVDRPETAFEVGGAYDMEAAGFLAAASRCVSAELAQVVKVVSDTPDHPAAELDEGRIGALIEARLDEIFAVGRALSGLGVELASRRVDPPGWAEYLGRWRFSTTHRRQLRRLLERHAALAPGEPPSLPEARDAAAALAALRSSVRLLAGTG
jgi:hypothetical protein